jgi:hypothetical protein
MIFRVYEHYDDNEPITNGYNKPEECFICYELRSDLDSCTISLKTQVDYDKLCGCDGWIHKQCLDIWYKKQKKCPICRVVISERKNTIVTVVNDIPYSNQIYLFVCNSLNKLTRIIIYWFLFCTIVELYLSIIIAKKIGRDSYDNQNFISNTNLDFNHSELIDGVVKNNL